MYRLLDNRKALIALAIAIAFLAVAIPTCRMVGCSMESGSMASMDMMHMGSGAELGFFSTCGGEYSTTEGPLAIVPLGADVLVLAFAAACVAAGALASPMTVSRPVLVADATPPPPPEDPLGVRFRV